MCNIFHISFVFHNCIQYKLCNIIINCKIDCQPRQVWMMARHGIRYPNPDDIRKLLELRNVRDQIMINHEQRSGGSIFTQLFQQNSLSVHISE